MVQSPSTTLVVDTGPDFNVQLTRENVKIVDAILYTHSHSDHVTGMDDLRIIQGRSKKLIPVYLDDLTLTDLKNRFGYVFEQESAFYPAVVKPYIFSEADFGKVHTVGDIDFIPFQQDHGQGNISLGYRFGDIGYSTDMNSLDADAISVLKGIKIWIADCADYAHGHGTLHATLPDVLELNKKIGAEKVYLTHLKFFYDYQKMLSNLPIGYEPAYDGLKLVVA